jgi:hypothetical protein
MVSIKVSKNVSCQALPSFRLLLKKAQHFARTGVFPSVPALRRESDLFILRVC